MYTLNMGAKLRSPIMFTKCCLYNVTSSGFFWNRIGFNLVKNSLSQFFFFIIISYFKNNLSIHFLHSMNKLENFFRTTVSQLNRMIILCQLKINITNKKYSIVWFLFYLDSSRQYCLQQGWGRRFWWWLSTGIVLRASQKKLKKTHEPNGTWLSDSTKDPTLNWLEPFLSIIHVYLLLSLFQKWQK